MIIHVQVPEGILNCAERLDTGLRNGIKEATKLITNKAVDKAPRRTGTLKRSIHSEVSTLGSFTGKIIQDSGVAKYGVFVEFGTGLYGPKGDLIYPNKAKVLAWKQGGQQFFARYTKGMKAQPYMRPAFEESKEEVKGVLEEEISKALGGG
jgi:HK97 gp10 family phage protein